MIEQAVPEEAPDGWDLARCLRVRVAMRCRRIRTHD